MFSSGHHNAAFYRRLWRSVLSTGSWEGEIWNQRKNGELFPEWLTISAGQVGAFARAYPPRQRALARHLRTRV